MFTAGKSILALSAATAMMAIATGPVAAATMRTEGPPPYDALQEWADLQLPNNEFVLNSQDDVELIRYKKAHDVQVCVTRPDPAVAFDTHKVMPVQVKWDNDTSVIQPGNCLSFDAKSVKLRPAADLPEDTELTGTFRVMR